MDNNPNNHQDCNDLVSDNNSCSNDTEYEPEYETEVITITNDVSLEILSVVPPPLEYMSMLHSKRQEISGRQVWTGSYVLANVLLHNQKQNKNDNGYRFSFSNQRVLELGSGTGILGMTISRTMNLGRNDNIQNDREICYKNIIVLTDGDFKAIELLESNLCNANNQIATHSVKAIHLQWFINGDQLYDEKRQQFLHSINNAFSSTSHHNNNIEKEYDDSQNHDDNDDILFDSIIAGDVLYKDNLLPLFFDTVKTFLKKKNGTLFLCHIPRNNVTQERVQQFATESGFTYKILTIPNHVLPPNENDDDDDSFRFPIEDVERAVVYQMYFA